MLKPLGRNGAALAALGDSPVDLIVDPLMPREAELIEDGVKVGESTLSRFFMLIPPHSSKPRSSSRCSL